MATPLASSPIEIKTPRVLIRLAVESDAAAFHQFLINPKNFPFQPTETDLTLERVIKRIGFFAKTAAEGKHAWVIFTSRETGEFLGYGGFNAFEEVEASEFLGKDASAGKKWMMDWGIMLDHTNWRKGYGLEIGIGLVEHARGLGAELFRTETDNDNEPWRLLMKALGVSDCEARGNASYDEKVEVWNWKWDLEKWEEAKGKLKAEGKWTGV